MYHTPSLTIVLQNSFLIVTLSSGLFASIPAIANNPASVATILAQNMPRASTFFITYVMTQAAGSIGNLLQPVTLVIYLIKLILQGGTPRSVYNKKYSMQTPTWGQTFPAMTLLSVIGTYRDVFIKRHLTQCHRYLVRNHQSHRLRFGGSSLFPGICRLQVSVHLGGESISCRHIYTPSDTRRSRRLISPRLREFLSTSRRRYLIHAALATPEEASSQRP